MEHLSYVFNLAAVRKDVQLKKKKKLIYYYINRNDFFKAQRKIQASF